MLGRQPPMPRRRPWLGPPPPQPHAQPPLLASPLRSPPPSAPALPPAAVQRTRGCTCLRGVCEAAGVRCRLGGGEAYRAPAGPTSEALVPRAGLMTPAWRASTVSGVDDVAEDRTPDDVRHPIHDDPSRHERGGVVDPLLRAFGLMVIEVLLGIQEVPRHNWLLASRAQDDARDEVQEHDHGEADNEDLEQFDIAFACADCKQARVQTGTGISGEANPQQATHPHSG